MEFEVAKNNRINRMPSKQMVLEAESFSQVAPACLRLSL
jgi:hypothetical protein